MHLRKAYNKKTGRTYLSIVHSYRDNEKKPKSKVIKSIGYLDELVKEYPDPLAHFTVIARSMEDERLQSKTKTISLDMNEQIERGSVLRKNYGSIVFSKVYHELEIDRFLNNARRHENFSFNTESIIRNSRPFFLPHFMNHPEVLVAV